MEEMKARWISYAPLVYLLRLENYKAHLVCQSGLSQSDHSVLCKILCPCKLLSHLLSQVIINK